MVFNSKIKVEFHLYFRVCLLELKKVACKSCKKFKSSLKKLQEQRKSPLKKFILIRFLFLRGTKYPLERTSIANDSIILNRVKILSVDTKEKESIVNIFFHRYDRRRWKKFHRLCYVHSKDKNATHTEKYARAGR